MVASEDCMTCFGKTRISLKGKETKKAKKHIISTKQEHSHGGDLSSGQRNHRSCPDFLDYNPAFLLLSSR